MSHRVVREHRRLENLLAALGDEFSADSSVERIWPAFEQLSDELNTHFEQEDHLYFPAIWALRPEFKVPLEELGRRHDWFRNQLRRIGDHLGHDDLRGAAEVFRSIHESFCVHEQIEEQILKRLDIELET